MKLKEGFVSEPCEDGQLLRATGDAANFFHGIVKSNKTAAFIVDCLKEETSEEKIIALMCEKYDAPREQITNDVMRIIAQLERIGAIEE